MSCFRWRLYNACGKIIVWSTVRRLTKPHSFILPWEMFHRRLISFLCIALFSSLNIRDALPNHALFDVALMGSILKEWVRIASYKQCSQLVLYLCSKLYAGKLSQDATTLRGHLQAKACMQNCQCVILRLNVYQWICPGRHCIIKIFTKVTSPREYLLITFKWESSSLVEG